MNILHGGGLSVTMPAQAKKELAVCKIDHNTSKHYICPVKLYLLHMNIQRKPV